MSEWRKLFRWIVQGGGSQAQEREPGQGPKVGSTSEILRSNKGANEAGAVGAGTVGEETGGNEVGEIQITRTSDYPKDFHSYSKRGKPLEEYGHELTLHF